MFFIFIVNYLIGVYNCKYKIYQLNGLHLWRRVSKQIGNNWENPIFFEKSKLLLN